MWEILLKNPITWLIELPTRGVFRQCWTDEQRETIVKLHALFQKTDKNTPHEAALAQHLASEGRMPIYQRISWSMLLWTLFWLAFLLGFRWSSTIQAFFFWNPRVREMLSLWFIPLLLLLLPPLRRHLLTPFRDRLLMAANPGTFEKLAFFPEVPARLDDGSIAPVATHLERLHGTVIVRGEAGLGKTSALRWLAIKSATPVAFLHARDCAEGVDAAIAKLIHSVQDVSFVKSLIHTRTLRVFIDGLNEVSADTRERVASFAKEMSLGDIYIGTQPFNWHAPEGARTLNLLPLRPEERKTFLLSRPAGADVREKNHGDDYKRAVETFLRQSLDEAPTEEQRAAAELMLSNPFDLTFAADLLAKGTIPRAGALVDAAFHVADQGDGIEPGYQSVNGQPFPLEKFGQHAIAMRLEDRIWFKPDEFPAEIACLLKAKLVVPRPVPGPNGIEDRTQFRHDRVWDFFIAAAFELDPDICEQHMDDVRFNSVYLRIAETWDPRAAIEVRDKLVVLAAIKMDNMTSNEFIRRLEKRIRAKKSAAKLAVVEQSADG